MNINNPIDIIEWVFSIAQAIVDFLSYEISVLGYTFTIGNSLLVVLPVLFVAMLVKKVVPLA